MKHFKVFVIANAHEFEYSCSAISEAYDAVYDASAIFGIDLDLDKIMESLVMMKQSHMTRAEMRNLRILVADGEV